MGLECGNSSIHALEGGSQMSNDDGTRDGSRDGDEILTEEMLWDRIPEVSGEERADTYY